MEGVGKVLSELPVQSTIYFYIDLLQFTTITMCGISATFGFLDENLIKQMLQKIHHRGEDCTQMVNVQDIATLGFNRLSIVDLEGGNQPLSDVGETKFLVCNGEIYNHQALRDIHDTYPFKTKSDAEVILALYEKHGEECIKFLDGMFAFVLVDVAKVGIFQWIFSNYLEEKFSCCSRSIGS